MTEFHTTSEIHRIQLFTGHTLDRSTLLQYIKNLNDILKALEDQQACIDMLR